MSTTRGDRGLCMFDKVGKDRISPFSVCTGSTLCAPGPCAFSGEIRRLPLAEALLVGRARRCREPFGGQVHGRPSEVEGMMPC